MKQIILIFVIITLFVITACSKQDMTEATCTESITNPEWETEDFKADYTIQFPDDYEGMGMVGFEGNFFSKNKPDNQAVFSYNFCGPLFCNDFGGDFHHPTLNSILIKDEDGNEVFLDSYVEYCLEGEIIGMFYHNSESEARGRYFMKEEGVFKHALDVRFSESMINEVKQIIQTIMRKA